MKVTIKVPDITCDHCKMTIEKALQNLSETVEVEVDLPKKTVIVSGSAEVSEIINVIRLAGYTAGEIQSIKL